MLNLKQKAPLLIKKLNEAAILPKKGSDKAAGYDLYAMDSNVVPAKGKQIIKTGLAINVPTGNYARIAPRSGLAWKNFIDVGAGVVDEDYRGEVGVILYNHSDVDFEVKSGDRIAQMIIEKITETEIIQVDELDQTERGAGGFGSTGVSRQDNQNVLENGNGNKRDFTQIEQQNMENLQISENQYDWKEQCIVQLYNLALQGVISQDLKKKIGNLIITQDLQRAQIILQKYEKDQNKETLKTDLMQLLLQ